jgi:TonB family protein
MAPAAKETPAAHDPIRPMTENGRSAEQMPQSIGRYQVQDSIGFGAMGAVYKAFDPLIKRTLAIKTIRLDIPKQSPQYRSFIERFYHEARISGTLSHPNIVTLFDIGEEGGLPYLAMEFVEGETIASILERGIRFKPEKVIGLVSQIASAVDYAHSKGVIHRDIKPSNLILYEGERVKVTDFGIAKLVDAEMTQSGTLLGTPSYMSPEQAMGDKLDGRSDIFSLGVCAFEMLCGEQPFPGNNVTSILYKLVHVDPIEPANLEMNGLVPQKWHEVFGRVLAKKPDDRYQTATDFVQDLEYCLGAWFGAMGDQTLSEEAAAATIKVSAVPITAPPAAAAPPPVPAVEETRPLPVLPEEPPPAEELPATIHMKAPDLSSRPAVPPPLPPVPPPPPREAEVATILMPAVTAAQAAAAVPPPVPSASGEVTILMNAPVTAKAAAAAAAAAKAPEPAPEPAGGADDATVVLKSPPDLRPPAVKPPPPPRASGAAEPRTPPPPRVSRPPVPPPPPVTPRDDDATPAPGPVPRSDGKKASTALLIGGAVLLLVLALGAFLAILAYNKITASLRPSPGPSAAVPPPAPSPSAEVTTTPTVTPAAVTGALRVETQPEGATVTVNGVVRGVTPLDLTELPLGSYEVKLDLKGYAPSVQAVVLNDLAPRGELKVALGKTVPAMGSADVVSNPAGAAVKIDGSPVGQTPVSDFKLKPGPHRVEITKEGFEPWQGTVIVTAGKRARADAFLKAIPKPTPTPQPADEVDTSRVYVNSTAEVDVLAKKVTGNSASYPNNAPRLRSGDSVSVRIGFVVNETGEITDLKILESAGKVVDEAVMDAVRKWKYSPAQKKGVKVKSRVEFRQTFRAG